MVIREKTKLVLLFKTNIFESSKNSLILSLIYITNFNHKTNLKSALSLALNNCSKLRAGMLLKLCL